MRAVRKQRLKLIIFVMVGLSLALSVILYTLSDNINVFYTPSELKEKQVAHAKKIRVGGLVVPDSVVRDKHSLWVSFSIADDEHELKINYNGILPDLFREGQGIIAIGQMIDESEFEASEVLAKHDENYTPPELQNINNKFKAQYE